MWALSAGDAWGVHVGDSEQYTKPTKVPILETFPGIECPPLFTERISMPNSLTLADERTYLEDPRLRAKS
jgi:hypothetical protein